MSHSQIFSLNQTVKGTGSLGISNIKDEGRVRFVIENAGPANHVRVKGRIIGQTDWDVLASLTANAKSVVNILTYDEIEVEVLVYSSLSNHIKVIATSFNDAGGATISVGVSSGDQLNNLEKLNFTSSDGSVIIQGIAPDTVDLRASALGAKYAQSFTVGDFVFFEDSYLIQVPESTHKQGVNPTVVVCEDIGGGELLVVNTIIEIDSLGNIFLKVSSTPDLRFSGKIIIE